MNIYLYILEWVFSFFIIWGLNFALNNLFKKKFNPLMASIFSFIIIGFLFFIIDPYVYTFPISVLIYLPIAIFFFVITVIKILKFNL